MIFARRSRMRRHAERLHSPLTECIRDGIAVAIDPSEMITDWMEI
jgi:hypothetical protein